MSIRKGLLITLLVAAMLFMLLPSPALADGWVGVIVVGALIVFILGIYMVWEWDGYYDITAGDIFIDFQGGLLSSKSLTTTLGLKSVPTERTGYNIDWLFTKREDGRAWVGAGFTFEFLFGPTQFNESDFRYGNNIILGYRKGSWDHKWLIHYFPDGEFRTNAEIAYRF